MRFIDLFSGLGGFHLALKELGHKCVFACEIDEGLQEIYAKNFGLKPVGDIRNISAEDVPKHEILCAGFPCQPFSKAGCQNGFRDRERGNLLYDIMRIVRKHKPKFIILENVPNIRTHNNGNVIRRIKIALAKEGYEMSSKDLSPHNFGIPQNRMRTYIVAAHEGLDSFTWPDELKIENCTIESILEQDPKNPRYISKQMQDCLDDWQEFLDIIPKDAEIPKPLWAMEFGATYPYKKTVPNSISLKKLRKYRGSFGKILEGKKRKKVYINIPSHAREEKKHFPKWKIRMIRKNRLFYQRYKKILKPWVKKISRYPSSYQKLEWNISNGPRDIRKYIIQFRASGVRAKKLDTAPALVAMNTSQIPIIPWQNRHITPLECSRLQSMQSLRFLPNSNARAYKALGNAVNVDVVKRISSALIGKGD